MVNVFNISYEMSTRISRLHIHFRKPDSQWFVDLTPRAEYQSSKALDTHSIGTWFGYRPEQQLLWWCFPWFYSVSSYNTWAVYHISHSDFLPNPFQFIIYWWSYHSTLCSIATESIINMKFWEELIAYFPWYDTGHIENDASNNCSIVACVFVTAETFLPSRCLAAIGGLLPSRCLATIRGIYRQVSNVIS
jgi:hypothetical protein